MSCLQFKPAYPLTGHKGASPSLSRSSHLRASCSYSFPTLGFFHRKALPGLVCSMARYHESPTCLLGGKGKYENGNEVPPCNAAEQAMQFSRKGPSMHDMLRKQMKEREFGGGGGSGRHGRSGGDGSGDEDGGCSAHLNELLQVVLATISFMLVYTFLIRREEMTRLSSDYIKYLLGGKPSPRLRRVMRTWGRCFQKIKGKELEEPSEGALDSSPTW